MTTLSEFQSAYEEATATIAAQESELALKESEIQILREKLRLLQFRQFGKSSERLAPDVQELMVFLAAAAPAAVSGDESDTIFVPAHEKKKPGRKRLSAELPREERLCDHPDR